MSIVNLNARIKCRIYCTMGGQTSVNTVYALTGTIVNSPTTADLATKLSTDLAALYKVLMPNIATFYGTSVFDRAVVPNQVPDTSRAGTGAGTGSGGPLPGQVSGLLSIRSIKAGRTGRGRLYLPFPAAIFMDTLDDAPTAAYVTAASAIGTYFNGTVTTTNGINSATYTFWIGSAKAPFSYNEWNAFTVQKRWATQKRRGDYGRTNLPPF